MSRLISHAKYELNRVGLYDKDSDYNGAIGEVLEKIVAVVAEARPSGGMMALINEILPKLLAFQPLSKLENIPEDWNDMSQYGERLFQNKRCSAIFMRPNGEIFSVDDSINVKEMFVSQHTS